MRGGLRLSLHPPYKRRPAIMTLHRALCFLALLVAMDTAIAQERIVDVPTRLGVTQRFLLIPTADAKAAAVLFAGGNGGLQFNDAGGVRSGRNNFLVRTAG